MQRPQEAGKGTDLDSEETGLHPGSVSPSSGCSQELTSCLVAPDSDRGSPHVPVHCEGKTEPGP